MAWFKRTEKSGAAERAKTSALRQADPPTWDVTILADYIRTQAPQWEHRTVDRALVEAWLGDRMRDVGLRPMASARFSELVSKVDGDAWRRLALATGAFDLPQIRAVLPALARAQSLDVRVYGAMVKLAGETDVLSLTLLAQSEVRAEEFARHFAAHLGVAISGETPDVSRMILERIDYRRLLAEAERVRGSAEEQLEYLRKLQEAQDAGRRRGKW